MAPRLYCNVRLPAKRATAMAATKPAGHLGRAMTIAATSALFAGAMVLWASGHARADSGTVEEQMACTPDVFRLCSAQIPSEERIVECLNKNIRKLSPACRKVIDGDSEPEKPRRRK